jgi:putative ABC transport system permease protein
MSFFSAIRVALAALLVNKGRSVLTSLGIVIGISAVIAMVSASGGLRGFVDERLDRLGTNLILIEAGGRTGEKMITDFTPLTIDDANAMRSKLKHLLREVAPSQMTMQVVYAGNRSHPARVVGSTHSLQQIRKWEVESPGRFYSEDDDKNASRVCVIGYKAWKALFPNQRSPVGESLRIGNTQLRILGVLKEKGASPTGADQDDQILLPLNTLQRYIKGDNNVQLILAAARDKAKIKTATKEIEELMRKRHGLRKSANNDFHVRSVDDEAQAGLAILDSIQALTVVIASISLIVGGIGIMNIMLVSVTERTREIGIRMAIGATPGDVLRQFLIEAVVLASVGGIIGITLGIAAAAGVGLALNWPVEPNTPIIVLAFVVAAGVGVFFGFYPARKASRLDPIEALRYE